MSRIPSAVYALTPAMVAFGGQLVAYHRMEHGWGQPASEVLLDVMLAEAWGYGLAGLCGVAATVWVWRLGPSVGRSVVAGFSGVLCALGLRHAGLARGWLPDVDLALLGSHQLAPTPQASVVALVLVGCALATLPRQREGWQVFIPGVIGWVVMLAPLGWLGARNTANIVVFRALALAPGF